MSERVWDRFLTAQDHLHLARRPAIRKGFGQQPALLLVDLYRAVFGDEPEPLLDAITQWPHSCGLAAWEALEDIRMILQVARDLGIPVVHIGRLDEVPGWHADRATRSMGGRDYELIEEVKPADGEWLLRKAAPSAFWGTPLAALLNELHIDTVLVCGESTSGCVRATVTDASSYRYKIGVIEDCVFDRHEAAHAMNLFDMNQKYADVISVQESIAYLRKLKAPSRN